MEPRNPGSNTGPARWVWTFVVSVLVAFALGYAAVSLVRWATRPAVPPGNATLPWRPAPVDVAPALLPGGMARPALDMALMHAGNRYLPSQTIALPTGSQFHLDLKATTSGAVKLQAINPAGESSQVWASELQGGQAVRTPDLKLQGQRGQERLRVIFVPASQPGVVVVEQVTVLHQ